MRRASSILSLLLLGSGLSSLAQPAEDAPQSFPLLPGTYWVYRGLVRSWRQGSTIGEVTDVKWTMSVIRIVKRDGVSAIVVKGFPTDLDWSDGHVAPELSILVETEDEKFYLNGEWSTKSVIDQIDNPRFPLQELMRADDWFLQLPLAEGKKFCDAEAMRRADGRYCWRTGPPHPVLLEAVRGLSPGKRTGYEIQYDTNPDDAAFEFVDGVGIASYQYHHHGTIADTELHLAEFHPPGR
jgi:hypothetical protein